MRNTLIFRNKLPVFIFLALTCLLVYANTFLNDFVWDDNVFIKDNHFIKSFANISKIFMMDFWEGSYRSYRATFYRPLVTASFLIDYALWGTNVFGYHLTNLFFYIMSVWLVFWIARNFLPITGAFLGTLIFLLHPVHTESVTFICGRTDLLSGFFLFLSVYFFTKTMILNRYLWVGLSVISYLAGLFCKEVGIIGIVIFIGIWFCFADKKQCNIKKFSKMLIPYLSVTIFYVLLRYSVCNSGYRHIPPGGKMLYAFFTTPKMWVMYFFKLLVPSKLSIEYTPEIVTTFFSFSFILPIVLLISCFAYLIFCYKHKKMRQVFFLSWIVLALLPVSNIIPIGVLIADRFLYIPSFGFAMFCGYWLDKISIAKKNKLLICLLIMFCFIVLTIRRNYDWKDQFRLWRKTARTNPASFRAHGSLAQIYMKKGMYEHAVDAINKAYLFNPNDHRVLGNMAVIYMELKQYDNAEKTLKKALKLEPRDFRTYGNLFGVYIEQNKLADALWAINQAIRCSPRNIQLRLARADYFRIAKQSEKSLAEYIEILKMSPKNLDALFALGDIYISDFKDYEKAGRIYKKILRLDRSNSRAIKKLHELKKDISYGE